MQVPRTTFHFLPVERIDLESIGTLEAVTSSQLLYWCAGLWDHEHRSLYRALEMIIHL